MLSLGGSACPACGSLLLVDLAQEDGDATTLPSEVPGLDEAVASWYELEGIEPPVPEQEEVTENLISGSLPFGFSGESNTHISRLPFGVGSYSGGMPFDESEEALPLISEAPPVSISEPTAPELKPTPAKEASEPPVASPPMVEPLTPVETPPPALNLPPIPEMPSLPPIPALSAPQPFSPKL